MRYFFLILVLAAFFAGSSSLNCKFCMSSDCNPSMKGVSPSAFDPIADSKALNETLRIYPMQDDVLISILAARSDAQRQDVVEEYARNKINLRSNIFSETSGRFRKIMVALVTPLVTFYTKDLARAIKEEDRIEIGEILSTLTPCMIRKVSTKYNEIYERNLYDDLDQIKLTDAMRLSNADYVALVQSLTLGDRDENPVVNQAKAIADAKRLKTAGVDYVFTDNAVFVEIFTKLSMPQLAATLRQYQILRREGALNYFVSLEEDIRSEFMTSSLSETYITIARNALDQHLYFAEEIEKIMQKLTMFTSDENKLIRIIRGRGDIDLEEIKAAYKRQYKKPLGKGVNDAFLIKTSFTKALVGIIGK